MPKIKNLRQNMKRFNCPLLKCPRCRTIHFFIANMQYLDGVLCVIAFKMNFFCRLNDKNKKHIILKSRSIWHRVDLLMQSCFWESLSINFNKFLLQLFYFAHSFCLFVCNCIILLHTRTSVLFILQRHIFMLCDVFLLNLNLFFLREIITSLQSMFHSINF